MMKQLIQEQYQAKINQLIDSIAIKRPKEGWIRTMRKALGMSSPQLAKRLAISKSGTSQMERLEVDDRITLKQLRRAADALGSDLVYAFVPRKPLGELLYDRALEKSKKLVSKANDQMVLEAQQLSQEKLASLAEAEARRLMNEMPRDLWED